MERSGGAKQGTKGEEQRHRRRDEHPLTGRRGGEGGSTRASRLRKRGSKPRH